ncbi:MAG: elongation factor P [Patescibacteria group bacterium]|nr:elongation factor P [Patescibacteria group bacterium]
MISVTDLRNGAVFEENSQLLKVLKYEHVKLGRGTATIKVKVRNLRTGSVTEKTFISGARVQDANLTKKEAQFLYSDNPSTLPGAGSKQPTDNNYYFMDPITYEQFSISGQKLGDESKFLQEGVKVQLLLYQDEPLSIELPIKMDFKVVQADPGLRGNSATNIYKDAVLQNGLKIKVPLFVNEGEMVRIDTRTGEYVERVGK